MDAALGTSWRSSSSRFVPNSPPKKTTPVTLPPGRLRLATTPSLTGSPPVANTIGTVFVAALAAIATRLSRDDRCHLPADQISNQNRQLITLIVRIAILDRDVLAFDEARFFRPWRRAVTRCDESGERACCA